MQHELFILAEAYNVLGSLVPLEEKHTGELGVASEVYVPKGALKGEVERMTRPTTITWLVVDKEMCEPDKSVPCCDSVLHQPQCPVEQGGHNKFIP
jgi:hypothetical protein